METSNSQGFQHSFDSKGQGVLVFEKADGAPDIVTARQIAQSLNDCNVPIFVLNACKSAQEGGGSFSSVARYTLCTYSFFQNNYYYRISKQKLYKFY